MNIESSPIPLVNVANVTLPLRHGRWALTIKNEVGDVVEIWQGRFDGCFRLELLAEKLPGCPIGSRLTIQKGVRSVDVF
jgi:hypothetical protein